MRLSLIIPVRNGREVLPRCLAGVTRGTRRADEVIVVDDGSTDETARIAREHGASVVLGASKARGPAWARNRGAQRANGDVLVFVDADVVLHADALERMVRAFEERPELDALFGSYDAAPPAPGIASRYKNLLHHYVHQHSKREARSFWGACGAVRRDVFFGAGGFDERYTEPSVEDIELGLRLTREGRTIRLCPEIQATHLKRWTLGSLWRTDVFARAVPWTRLVLREAHVPNDLNLTWKSRASAALACTAAALFATAAALAAYNQLPAAGNAGLGALGLLTVSTLTNADLYLFFARRGGVLFAAGAWLLHQVYLLYSSVVFALLVVAQALDFRVTASAPRPKRGMP